MYVDIVISNVFNCNKLFFFFFYQVQVYIITSGLVTKHDRFYYLLLLFIIYKFDTSSDFRYTGYRQSNLNIEVSRNNACIYSGMCNLYNIERNMF